MNADEVYSPGVQGPYLQQVMDILPPRPFGTAVERVAIYLDNPVSGKFN